MQVKKEKLRWKTNKQGTSKTFNKFKNLKEGLMNMLQQISHLTKKLTNVTINCSPNETFGDYKWRNELIKKLGHWWSFWWPWKAWRLNVTQQKMWMKIHHLMKLSTSATTNCSINEVFGECNWRNEHNKKIRASTKLLMNLKSLKVECDISKTMKGNYLLGWNHGQMS